VGSFASLGFAELAQNDSKKSLSSRAKRRAGGAKRRTPWAPYVRVKMDDGSTERRELTYGVCMAGGLAPR
jgi:hypothetical protein